MKKWLLQSNIWQEYDYDRLVDSINDRGIDLTFVDLIPFTEEWQKPIPEGYIPDIVLGSNRFVNVCRAKGFPTFKSFKPIEEFYPNDLWLNGDGYDITLGEFREWINSCNYSGEELFIKPYTEKFFTGKILEDAEDLDKIQFATSFIENEDDELIRVSPSHIINQECRFFIIGGEVITGSLYRDGGRVCRKALMSFDPVYDIVKDLIIKYGCITDAFVLDLGLTEKYDWKIVELNNLNSAGIYKCNTDAIVSALQNL